MGVLSGRAGDGQGRPGGLAAAFVIGDDSEPGSPWSFVVHVDERGSESASAAAVLTGSSAAATCRGCRVQAGGAAARAVDRAEEWRRAASRVGSTVETHPAFPRGARLLRIPGHQIAGAEYYTERLVVHDDPFDWEHAGNCAFVSTFSYSS
jgi:hypothetical protein